MKFKSKLLSAIMLASVSGCNPFVTGENLSLEEVISTVSTPREAQNYINDNIRYAYEDIQPNSQREIDDFEKGGVIQSFRETYERKAGVCRDGSAAIAAMLYDDGYTPYLLTVTWKKDNKNQGHSVFVYQENGKWGSAGINSADFIIPKYNNLKELSKKIVSMIGGEYSGYFLYDEENNDLIDGNGRGRLVPESNIIESDYPVK